MASSNSKKRKESPPVHPQGHGQRPTVPLDTRSTPSSNGYNNVNAATHSHGNPRPIAALPRPSGYPNPPAMPVAMRPTSQNLATNRSFNSYSYKSTMSESAWASGPRDSFGNNNRSGAAQPLGSMSLAPLASHPSGGLRKSIWGGESNVPGPLPPTVVTKKITCDLFEIGQSTPTIKLPSTAQPSSLFKDSDQFRPVDHGIASPDVESQASSTISNDTSAPPVSLGTNTLPTTTDTDSKSASVLTTPHAMNENTTSSFIYEAADAHRNIGCNLKNQSLPAASATETLQSAAQVLSTIISDELKKDKVGGNVLDAVSTTEKSIEDSPADPSSIEAVAQVTTNTNGSRSEDLSNTYGVHDRQSTLMDGSRALPGNTTVSCVNINNPMKVHTPASTFVMQSGLGLASSRYADIPNLAVTQAVVCADVELALPTLDSAEKVLGRGLHKAGEVLLKGGGGGFTSSNLMDSSLTKTDLEHTVADASVSSFNTTSPAADFDSESLCHQPDGAQVAQQLLEDTFENKLSDSLTKSLTTVRVSEDPLTVSNVHGPLSSTTETSIFSDIDSTDEFDELLANNSVGALFTKLSARYDIHKFTRRIFRLYGDFLFLLHGNRDLTQSRSKLERDREEYAIFGRILRTAEKLHPEVVRIQRSDLEFLRVITNFYQQPGTKIDQLLVVFPGSCELLDGFELVIKNKIASIRDSNDRDRPAAFTTPISQTKIAKVDDSIPCVPVNDVDTMEEARKVELQGDDGECENQPGTGAEDVNETQHEIPIHKREDEIPNKEEGIEGKNDVDSLTKEVNELKEALRDLGCKHFGLQQDMTRAVRKGEETRGYWKSTEAGLRIERQLRQVAEGKVASLQDTVTATQGRLDIAEASHQRQALDWQAQLSTAIKDKHAIENDLSEAKATAQSLSKDLTESNEMIVSQKTQIVESESLVRQLLYKHECKVSDIRMLQAKYAESNAEAIGLRWAHGDLQRLQAEFKNATSKFEKAEDDKDSARIKLIFAEREVKSLEKDLATHKKENARHESRIEELATAKHDLEIEMDRLRARNTELNEKVTSIQSDLDIKNDEASAHKYSDEQRLDKIKSLDNKIITLEDGLESKDREILMLKDAKKQSLERISALEKENTDQAASFKIAKEIMQEIVDQAESYKVAKESMQNELIDQPAVGNEIVLYNVQEHHEKDSKAAEAATAAAEHRLIVQFQPKNIICREPKKSQSLWKTVGTFVSFASVFLFLILINLPSMTNRTPGAFKNYEEPVYTADIAVLPVLQPSCEPVPVYGTGLMVLPGVESLPGRGGLVVYDPYPCPFRRENQTTFLDEMEIFVDTTDGASSRVAADIQIKNFEIYYQPPAPSSTYKKVGNLLVNIIHVILTRSPAPENRGRARGWR